MKEENFILDYLINHDKDVLHIYADWLEENDISFGELLRIAIMGEGDSGKFSREHMLMMEKYIRSSKTSKIVKGLLRVDLENFPKDIRGKWAKISKKFFYRGLDNKDDVLSIFYFYPKQNMAIKGNFFNKTWIPFDITNDLLRTILYKTAIFNNHITGLNNVM